MSRTTARPGKGRSLTTSIIVGMILVPVSAVAAVAIVNPRLAPEPQPELAAETDPGDGPAPTLAADLETACGPAGSELAELVRAGTASGLQQAALDALHPICAAVEMPLPAGSAPPSAPEEVLLQTSSSSSATVPDARDDPEVEHDDRDDDDRDDDDRDDDDRDDDDWDDDDRDDD